MIAAERPAGGAGLYVRLLAALALVDLATSLLRMVGWAHRAGYLGVAHVEYSVRISARLRRRAGRLIGTKPGNAS